MTCKPFRERELRSLAVDLVYAPRFVSSWMSSWMRCWQTVKSSWRLQKGCNIRSTLPSCLFTLNWYIRMIFIPPPTSYFLRCLHLWLSFTFCRRRKWLPIKRRKSSKNKGGWRRDKKSLMSPLTLFLWWFSPSCRSLSWFPFSCVICFSLFLNHHHLFLSYSCIFSSLFSSLLGSFCPVHGLLYGCCYRKNLSTITKSVSSSQCKQFLWRQKKTEKKREERNQDLHFLFLLDFHKRESARLPGHSPRKNESHSVSLQETDSWRWKQQSSDPYLA